MRSRLNKNYPPPAEDRVLRKFLLIFFFFLLGLDFLLLAPFQLANGFFLFNICLSRRGARKAWKAGSNGQFHSFPSKKMRRWGKN
jgi:hypothetical protein